MASIHPPVAVCMEAEAAEDSEWNNLVWGWMNPRRAITVVQLVDYTSAYRSDALSLIQGFWLAHNQYQQTETEAQGDLDTWTQAGHRFFLIRTEDGFVGFLHLGSRGGACDWLEDIFVKPAYQNRGIGTQAIRLVEEIVRTYSVSMYIEAAALVHVDLGQMVHHGDGFKLAGQGAALAANAAHPAVVADQVSLVGGAAQQPHGTGHRLKLQHMLGTSFHTLAAALALFGINHGDFQPLINVDGVKGAGAHAGAKSQAGVLAGTVTVGNQRSSHAILNAGILELVFAMLNIALADYLRHLLYGGGIGRNTHDGCDLLGHSRAAHRAGVYGRFAGSNGIRAAVAARVAAAAAVGAGQHFTHGIPLGIGRNRKYLGGARQHKPEHEPHGAQDNGSP